MKPTAAELRKLLAEAERREADETLADVARMVGLGLGTLAGPDRSADTARRRAVAAWILVDRVGWTEPRTARALGRTVRGVQKMLREQRETLKNRG